MNRCGCTSAVYGRLISKRFSWARLPPRRAPRRVLSRRGEPRIDRADRRPADQLVGEQRMTVRDAGSLGEGANETGLIGAASAAAAEHERMRDDAVRRRMPVARRPGKCRRGRWCRRRRRWSRSAPRPSRETPVDCRRDSSQRVREQFARQGDTRRGDGAVGRTVIHIDDAIRSLIGGRRKDDIRR